MTGPVVTAHRRQAADRTAAQTAAGSYTLLADAHDRFCSVKPVGWVRSRVGDERHWTQTPLPPPSQAHSLGASQAQVQSPSQAHPALLALREEQARAAERAQLTRAASLESRTSSSVYGSHTLQRPSDPSVVADPSRVNSVGAEQILSQQTRLWGSLQATSRRLGFGVSHAPAGSALSHAEKAHDQRNYMSVATMSYGARAKDAPPPVIAVPESMNRTSCNFPLSPAVNQMSAPRPAPSAAAVAAANASSQQLSADASPAATLRSPSRSVPSASASSSYDLSDTSTAHALGYGKRHQFHRHYLSSTPIA